MNRRLLLMLTTAAGLAGYALWSADGGLFATLTGVAKAPEATIAADSASPGPQASASGQAKSLNPLSGLTLELLSEMTARPLFNPSRAPAPVAETPPPEPVVTEAPAVEDAFNADDYILVAIGSGVGGAVAVIRRNSTNEVFHLKQGELLSEWEIKQVGLREITIARDDRTVELKLFQQRVDVAAQPAMLPDGADPQVIVEGDGQDEGEPDNTAQKPGFPAPQQDLNPIRKMNPIKQ